MKVLESSVLAFCQSGGHRLGLDILKRLVRSCELFSIIPLVGRDVIWLQFFGELLLRLPLHLKQVRMELLHVQLARVDSSKYSIWVHLRFLHMRDLHQLLFVACPPRNGDSGWRHNVLRQILIGARLCHYNVKGLLPQLFIDILPGFELL